MSIQFEKSLNADHSMWQTLKKQDAHETNYYL
jgi:hypothetical protein